jgi:uncharacterized PurR-regulated membrane protein YhhQ (DUF165 family)
MRPRVVALVAAYLAAIVAANLIVTHYGPTASIYCAFFLIGLDLTTRDALHDFWRERRLPKMLALILAGSALSYALNTDARKIAEASAIAFACAALADYAVYTILWHREWLERSNLSNVVAAAVDSFVFPTLAFGGILWGITFGQFTAKVAGGVLWSIARTAYRRRPARVTA